MLVDLQFEKGTTFRLGGNDLLQPPPSALVIAKAQDMSLPNLFVAEQAVGTERCDLVESPAQVAGAERAGDWRGVGHERLPLVELAVDDGLGGLLAGVAAGDLDRDAGGREREMSQYALAQGSHRNLDLVLFDRLEDGVGDLLR